MTGNAWNSQMAAGERKTGVAVIFYGKFGGRETVHRVAFLAGAALCPPYKLSLVIIPVTIAAVAEGESP